MKSQVSFDQSKGVAPVETSHPSSMTNTEIIKLSHQASTTPVSPTNEPVLPSTEPPLKTNNSSGLAKIPTTMLVGEITEIENDESPNRKT